MEVAMELEDDLFFADLSKQISLLIMDDDEDPVANCSSVSFQTFHGRNYPTATVPPPFMYEQTCSRESKGTGVFIPRSSQPRRKHRQGRHGSFDRKSNRQQQQHHDTRTIHRVSCNSKSLNPKKG